MRLFGLFIFTILSQNIHGQWWNCAWPHSWNHSISLKTFKGDSVNRQNQLGEYFGTHIYADTNCLTKIESYTIGEFRNGIPHGTWEERCADGSYSYGFVKAYHCMVGFKIVEIKNTIDNKVGIWKYFNGNGDLTKTEHYERPNKKNGWVQKISRMDSSGKMMVTLNNGRLEYLFGLLYRNFRYEYFDNGRIKHREVNSSFRVFTKDYYDNGNLRSHLKLKGGFWTGPKWRIEKRYDELGQITDRIKKPIRSN